MPIAQFPTPLNPSFPAEPAGPIINILQNLPIEYMAATVNVFKDGGASYGLSNTNGILRFLLHYQGLSAASAATLDTHYNSANGIFGGFNFRHPRTNTLYTDVHYESYEYPRHEKYWNQTRTITLIKRPTG